jgi:hypothetical protein
MKCLRKIGLIGIGMLVCLGVEAQNPALQDNIPPFILMDGDTVKTMILRDVFIYPNKNFGSVRQEDDLQYQKLVRDVKKTLPYAKLVYNTIIETYAYMQTLPDDKSRQTHLKQMEKDLFAEYKPIMAKMTLSQGKLLIKLIDRECNQSSFFIIKAYLGPFRAGFWNLFASIFGASLKTEWDPDGKDSAAERIVQMIEMDLL